MKNLEHEILDLDTPLPIEKTIMKVYFWGIMLGMGIGSMITLMVLY